MDVTDRVVVITGGGGGIGGALARRFHSAGARGVVVADLANAEPVAAALNSQRQGSALAVTCDISQDQEVAALVEQADRRFGPIDIFCANAGIGVGIGPETPDADWDRIWRINVMAHVLAARHLLPHWLARGEGYFVATASAAGLLTQIGSAPYAVTKHAAVAFAEWLAVTYGDQGVRVSCLCPQGVNTAMLSGGASGSSASIGADTVRLAGAVLEPDTVAQAVLEAVNDERFLILPHPEVLTYWRRNTADYDRWLAGMRRLQARVLGAE